MRYKYSVMLDKNNSTKGLPGLKMVRNAVGLTQEQLAFEGCCKVHLGQIELGNRDTTQATQRRLADLLSCKVADLVDIPTPARLQEIKDAFEVRKAKEVLARQADKKAGAA